MSKTKIIVFSLLAAAAIASFLTQREVSKQIHQRESVLRLKQDELTQLIEQQPRISNAISRLAIPQREDHATELAKLRRDVEALRKQSNELSNTSGQPHPIRNPNPDNTVEPHSKEYWNQLHAAAGAKPVDARDLARAATEFALEHKNQMPASINQLSSYLATSHSKLSGTNQFDLVFQGSIDDLQGIPNSQIAVIRDRDTWMTPDGKTARVYGMMGGIGQIVTSDDNFQSWEAEHVIGSLKK